MGNTTSKAVSNTKLHSHLYCTNASDKAKFNRINNPNSKKRQSRIEEEKMLIEKYENSKVTIVDMKEIEERLKDIISTKVDTKIVFRSNIAEALNMNIQTLRNKIKANVIPYEEIAIFCAKNKISINWLLFNQNSKSLQDGINNSIVQILIHKQQTTIDNFLADKPKNKKRVK